MKITQKLLSAIIAAVMLLSAAPVTGLNFTAEAKSSSSAQQTHKHKKVTKVKKATLSKNGTKTVTCSTCKKTLSRKTIYKIASVKLKSNAYSYTGKEIKAAIVVKDSKGKTLKAGTDYTVTYKNNKEVGKATATVTFKGDYSGTKKLGFSIVPKLSTDSTKDTVTVSWTKVPGAKTYKAALYNGKKLVKSVSTSKTSAKFTSLTPGTSYTVKLTALNGKKTVTSAEANVKTLSKNSVKAYRTEKLFKTIAKGTYLMTAKSTVEGLGNVVTTTAEKDGMACVKTTVSGITTRTVTLAKKKNRKYPTTYIIMDERKVYTEVPEEIMAEAMAMGEVTATSLEPKGSVFAVKVKENGKNLVCESYKTKGGLKVKIYFDGEIPVREEVTQNGITTVSTITKFTTKDISASLFKIPKSYTRLSFYELMGSEG